jgi:aminoglycoside 6'-N-acetyltransferase I
MFNARSVTAADAESWLSMRCALWPEGSRLEHREEIARFLAGHAREPQAVFVAEDEQARIVGFAELSIRPYAEGYATDRVAFVEGWYVVPTFRRRGVGRALISAAEQWGRALGCAELASDTQADNDLSTIAHRECGFAEVGLVRCFRKEI